MYSCQAVLKDVAPAKLIGSQLCCSAVVGRAAAAAGGQIIPAAGPEGAEGVLIPIGGYYHAADRAAIVQATDRYSASDLRLLAEDAVQEPLRELGERIASINIKDVRPCKKADFAKALSVIKPSADQSLLARYDEGAQKFGTRGN